MKLNQIKLIKWKNPMLIELIFLQRNNKKQRREKTNVSEYPNVYSMIRKREDYNKQSYHVDKINLKLNILKKSKRFFFEFTYQEI